MARNDGVDRTVARQGEYRRSTIANIERHHERKNEAYGNIDVQLEHSHKNIYFKKPTDTYLSMFDSMCENGTISTRGQRETAIIIDEMLCDVNSAYFEERGGYDYAKEFFSKAYDFAVKEAGGEEYILSAVMHADERNKDISEKAGQDVYHYHLHVIYVPVVKKEIKWSKRCKDKSLVGTVKEVITQVSHSKKWASHKATLEDGTSHLVPSYSLLQDRFFEYMRDCGYKDVERGEKGSKDENYKVAEFKYLQEEQRLKEVTIKANEMESKVSKGQKSLDKIADKKVKIKAVDDIETKPQKLDKSKITVDKSEFEELKTIAKKQIATVSKEKKLLANCKKLHTENIALKQEITTQKQELFQHTSIISKLHTVDDKKRVSELEKLVDLFFKFLDCIGFRKQFEEFIQPNKSKTRQEEL